MFIFGYHLVTITSQPCCQQLHEREREGEREREEGRERERGGEREREGERGREREREGVREREREGGRGREKGEERVNVEAGFTVIHVVLLAKKLQQLQLQKTHLLQVVALREGHLDNPRERERAGKRN